MHLPFITRDLVIRLEAAEAAYHEAKLRAGFRIAHTKLLYSDRQVKK